LNPKSNLNKYVPILYMGIPAFFRQIVENYPDTHTTAIEKLVDYFFIDFNSIIYDTYYDILKDINDKTTNSAFETKLINAVVQKIVSMVCEIVKPQKMAYIAFDGCAPRAKMIQQRWRRYKGVKEGKFMNELKDKHGIEKAKVEWDRSSNIAPGTKFMKKMSLALKKKIDMGGLSKHKKDLTIILSDGNVPGEGEHKFLPIIREMKDKDDVVCIYSPDADMIVLAMATMKKNMWIMRKVKGGNEGTKVEQKYAEGGNEYLYLSIDKYDDAFISNLELEGDKKNMERIITDYVFLTFLGGNDFVQAIPYIMVRKEETLAQKGGLSILINSYRQLLPKERDYLIIIKNGKYLVNHLFLVRIFESISKSEDYYMRGLQMKMDRVKEGQGAERKIANEEGKTEYEKERARYEHFEYYSPLHPEYEKYKPMFDKFDYKQPKHIWKAQYYKHYFNINQNDSREYNQYRTKICINYLEALVFTLKYYFEGIPSWTWFYQFRAPPVVSDLLTNLKRFVPNVNDLKFTEGKPYLPFEQLMMILPPQMSNLLPKNYGNLMKKDLLQYYPIDFELDVVLGGKYIYSEPILPYIDADHVLRETSKLPLTAEEKSRNVVNTEPYVKTGNIVKIKVVKKK
jgi:5'-3' exonuclease